MKAISIHSYYAAAIACGLKSVELRTWRTKYRGDILICSTKQDASNIQYKDSFLFGKAIAIASLSDCVNYSHKYRDAALIKPTDRSCYYNYNAFLLENIRPIEPISIRGQQRIYNVPIEKKDLHLLDVEPNQIFDYWKDNNLIKYKPRFNL